MLKRINWKAVLMGLCWAVCLSGLGVLMSFVEVKKQEVKCTEVKILIPGADNFIEREEIDAILMQGFGQLKGKDLETLNIHEIELRIKANPYIAFVKVYADMDGVVRIKVKQRQPVLRVINAGNQDFYIDNEGLKMPVSSNFTANVLVATGNITEPFNGKVEKITSKMLADLYKIARYVKKDTLWDAQIEQLYVDEKNDIELVPRVGIQKIILGNADRLEIKMNNLLIFYKKAMPKVGWEAYKSINLKYLNQIVCEKNKIDSSVKAAPSPIDTLVTARIAQDAAIKEALKAEVLPQPEPENENKADAQVINVTTSKQDKPKATKPAETPATDKQKKKKEEEALKAKQPLKQNPEKKTSPYKTKKVLN